MRLWTTTVLLTGWLLGGAGATSSEHGVAEGLAERMTREAIAAGAAGEIALREDLLQQATRMVPDHGPARWAQGEVEVDGEWKSIATVQEAARNNQQLQQYEDLKPQLADATAADHLELARWCRKNNLPDEARYHWLRVLAVDDTNREALRAIDSVWVDGELVLRSAAANAQTPRYKQRKTNREWRTRIARWERALAAGGDEAARALAALDAEVDESAIPEFERFAAKARPTTPRAASGIEQCAPPLSTPWGTCRVMKQASHWSALPCLPNLHRYVWRRADNCTSDPSTKWCRNSSPDWDQ